MTCIGIEVKILQFIKRHFFPKKTVSISSHLCTKNKDELFINSARDGKLERKKVGGMQKEIN